MQLAARHWGPDDDRPVALLLHGSTGSAETWWRVAPAFVDAGWRVTALDLRGHGSSPRSSSPFTFPELAADVAETLGGQAVDVAWGHSLGAITVMQLVVDNPGAVRRVILEDPPGSRPAGFVTEYALNLRAEAADVSQDHTGVARRLLAENPAWTDADGLAAVAGIASCDTELLIASYERWRGSGYEAAAMLGQIRIPVLLFIASDGVLGEPDRSRVRAVLPAESVIELASGHSLHRDRFDDCVRTALGWLEAR